MRTILVWFGEVFGLCAHCIGIRRTVTESNLQTAFPGLTKQQLRNIEKDTYRNLGRVFAEMIYLRFFSLQQIGVKTKIINPELYYQHISEGRGLIVVAAHYANWEWLALGGSLSLHSNFAIVRKNIPSQFSEVFLEKMRIRSGNTLVNSGDVRAMLTVLRAKGCLAILGDQAAPAESVKVNFFGIQTPTFEGPALLALRTGAKMLFAECRLTTDGVYEIEFYPVVISDTDTIFSLTQAHTSILESIIRKRPELWLWQHKRWKYVAQ